MIETATGNLLEADVEALVNTVNTKGALGKGIALQFKRAFPEMEASYKRACRTGEIAPGRVHVFERPDMFSRPHYIISFPTKRDWRHPSRLEDIEAGLRDLVRVIKERGIESVAIPPLGCGLGGLDWRDVYPMIADAALELDGVRVLVYPPAGSPPPESQVNRTRRPSMTAGRAALLGLLAQYCELDYPLSMLEIQKLAYFLQEAGQPLRLEFEKGPYGPYSDGLRKVLRHLEGHYILGFGDEGTSPDSPIRLLSGAAQDAEAFLTGDRETASRYKSVARLIEGYETPYGLELLSTVHWAATKESPPACDHDAALRIIREWSPRKSSCMTPEHVRSAWERLTNFGVVPVETD